MRSQSALMKLNQTLQHCRNSKFYQTRIPFRELTSIEQLKGIPLTTKDEIKEHSPYGFICVPNKDLYQYHETFGTTGEPASTWLTREDLLDCGARMNQWGIGFREEDRVLIRFPYALSTIAHFTHVAAQMKNACVIPASSRNSITPYPRIVNLMKKLDISVLASLPLQAVLIAETAEMLGFSPREDFKNLRAIYTAGEAMTRSKRQLIEQIWGVPVIDNYGMTEVGPMILDCAHGIPHPLEDNFIFEILDEDLKSEAAPGEIGHLVVTTLTRQATPLVRYLTGDRARKIHQACPCGRDISIQIKGRKQDSIFIEDREFDIWDLEEMVSHLPFHRFWVAGPFEGGLKFIVEQEKPDDAICDEHIRLLYEKYDTKILIEVVEKGLLYDRNELLAINSVGKPQYIYSEKEISKKMYVKSKKC